MKFLIGCKKHVYNFVSETQTLGMNLSETDLKGLKVPENLYPEHHNSVFEDQTELQVLNKSGLFSDGAESQISIQEIEDILNQS